MHELEGVTRMQENKHTKHTGNRLDSLAHPPSHACVPKARPKRQERNSDKWMSRRVKKSGRGKAESRHQIKRTEIIKGGVVNGKKAFDSIHTATKSLALR